MKIILSLVCLMFMTPAFAVELENATNRQILDELARRLQGTTPPIQEHNVAFYTCDTFARLNISVVTPRGQEYTAQMDGGSDSICSTTANILNAYKNKIANSTIVAICDSFNRVNRTQVMRNGSLRELPQISTRSPAECDRNSRQINQN